MRTWTDEERKALSERMKELNKDPEFREKANRNRSRILSVYNRSAKGRRRSRARLKARHRDPEYAKRHSERMKSLMGRLWEEGKISITLRGKKNYNYNGTKMRSSWEALFAAWLDSNSLEWEYEPKVFFYKDKNGRNRRYLPDFWVPQWGCFVEVKAQWAIDRPDCPALTKKRAVEAAGFPMRFVMNEEIETMKKEVA